MASRNVSGDNAGDSDSESELTVLNQPKAKPYVQYGDRMPFRQGMNYIFKKI